MLHPWRFREDIDVAGGDLVGYRVEATDGGIGTVDSWTVEVDSSHLVVDTGPLLFGHRAMVPAGTVSHLDHADRRVYLDRTREQVKAAPELGPSQEYRDKIASYYAGTYGVPDAAGGIFPPGAVPPGGAVPPPG